MARFGPILPIVGGNTRFQPVYVDDVAAAAVKGVNGEAAGVYELGGPDVETFKELMQRMLKVTYRSRLILNVPFFIARIMGGALDLVQSVTGGLIENKLLTRDQAKNLERDSVVTEGAQASRRWASRRHQCRLCSQITSGASARMASSMISKPPRRTCVSLRKWNRQQSSPPSSVSLRG